MNGVLLDILDVLIAFFSTVLLIAYCDIIFDKETNKTRTVLGVGIFFIWQLILNFTYSYLPSELNLTLTLSAILLFILFAYKGSIWKKVIFTATYLTLWMLFETLFWFMLPQGTVFFLFVFQYYRRPCSLGVSWGCVFI